MPSRLPQHLLACRAEHHAAAERVAVEQPRHDAAATFAPGPPAARQSARGLEGDVPQDGRVDQFVHDAEAERLLGALDLACEDDVERRARADQPGQPLAATRDRKSTRLNSSHDQISYAVFCLKKKK